MIRFIFRTTIGLLVTLSALCGGKAAVAADLHRAASTVFIRNEGQWPDSVLFRTTVDKAVAWIMRGGVVYQLFPDTVRSEGDAVVTGYGEEQWRSCRLVTMQLVGADGGAEVIPERAVGAKWNYFYGHNRDRWQTHVQGYEAVEVAGVYPGIGVRYYASDGKLEYDLLVGPGADLSQVRQRYLGVTGLEIVSGGDLMIHTDLGDISERAPRVVAAPGETETGKVRFELRDAQVVGYRLEGVSAGKMPVRIDPVVDFASVWGGSGGDPVQAVATGADGSIYLAGTTFSADFPVRKAFDSTYQSLYYGGDAYVMKLTPSGDSLVYATYIGGTYYEGDYCYDVEVGADGCATIIGNTGDYDFPAVGGFDSTYNGGIYDLFAAKLGPNGDTLMYGTYLGGGGGGGLEGARASTLDADGNLWVVGYTEEPSYPVVQPLQQTFGGQQDVVVTKVAADGKSILYSTFLGGSLVDYAYGCTMLSGGELAVAGYSNSRDLFTTWLPGPPVPTGDNDGFLTILSADGTTIETGRFLGGTMHDEISAVGIGPAGHVIVAGLTMSPDFPMVSPLYATHKGSRDMFVADLGPAGDSLLFSTYFGGSKNEYGWLRHLVVTGNGRVYLAGSTLSPDLPMKNALDGTLSGTQDGFLAEIDVAKHALVHSTLFGGVGNDAISGVAPGPQGSLLVCGTTTAPGFLPAGSSQFGVLGNGDSFVLQLSTCCAGMTGDLDRSSSVDLTDLSRLVAYLLAGVRGEAFCYESANIDGAGVIDLVDLARMVAYLTEAGSGPLPDCP